MTNDQALGAVFMHIGMTYLDCDLHPVTLTFRPFDEYHGNVRGQLRKAVADWVALIPAFLASHGHPIKTKKRDLLALGFMQYPVQVGGVSPQPVAAPTAKLVLCLPGPAFEDASLMELMNGRKAELLAACPYIVNQYVDYAFGEDGSVASILSEPFEEGLVTAADIVIATQDTAIDFDWARGR